MLFPVVGPGIEVALGDDLSCGELDGVQQESAEERQPEPDEQAARNKLMADAQKLVANDAVAAYLYQPTWITVANARVKGIWKDMPLFVNDVSAMGWQ